MRREKQRARGTRDGVPNRPRAYSLWRIHEPENANHDCAGINEEAEIREGCHRRPKQMFHCSSVRHLITLAGTKREQDGGGGGGRERIRNVTKVDGERTRLGASGEAGRSGCIESTNLRLIYSVI